VLQAPIKAVKRARRLRRQMSPPEKLLWWALKRQSGKFHFRKQCPQGPYYLDFACLSSRLAIEVDGEAHDRAGRPERDALRDAYMEGRGFMTLRIPAVEVFNNLDGVILGIMDVCRKRGPLHPGASRRGPPPRSGEELT